MLAISVFTFLFGVLIVLNTGCYAHMSGGGIALVVVHDSRWHYDHDYDEHWRYSHPYRRWDWETYHDERYRHEHPWHDEDN